MSTPWDWLPEVGSGAGYAVVTADGFGFGDVVTDPLPFWARVTKLDSDQNVDATLAKYRVAHGSAILGASLGPGTWTFTAMPAQATTPVALEDAFEAAEAAWRPDPAEPWASIWVHLPGRRFRLDGHFGTVTPTRITPGHGVGSVTCQFIAANPLRLPEETP